MTNPNTAPSAAQPYAIDGVVYAIARKDQREAYVMFDTPAQANGFVEYMRRFIEKPVPAQTGGEAVAPEARADVLKQLRTAMDVVSALCDGSMRWTMSVPARPDSDPDLVISGALHAAEKLIAAAPPAPPAPPAPLPGKESERDLFKVTFPHLDLEETPDSWGRPKFAKPMVDAIWYGWKHRAALSSPPTLEAAPADYPPQSEIEAIAERLGATDPDDSLWRDFAHAAIDADRAQRSGVSADPLPDTKPEICYSADGETFHDELSDVFDSLDSQGALVVGGTYHQGEAVRRTAGHYLHDIGCLFERMGEVAYDEAGEHKGDWPDNSLKPGEADELKELIKGWLDARVKVWFYTVANVKEVAITEQDLLDYYGPEQHQVKKGEPS